jgi:hypothetical protein
LKYSFVEAFDQVLVFEVLEDEFFQCVDSFPKQQKQHDQDESIPEAKPLGILSESRCEKKAQNQETDKIQLHDQQMIFSLDKKEADKSQKNIVALHFFVELVDMQVVSRINGMETESPDQKKIQIMGEKRTQEAERKSRNPINNDRPRNNG